MDKATSLREYKEYVKSMLDSYSNTLSKVMFDDFKVRATSEKDDEFAPFTMYLNTLIASLQRKDNEINKKTEELQKHQEHLEDQVAERTKQLELNKLQLDVKVENLEKAKLAMLNIMDDLKSSKIEIDKKNIELKKVDILKSNFLNITSHELRTPMTAMKGYIQMISKRVLGELTKEQQKALDVILRNTDRLDHLIQDILDTSRLESGTMKFSPKETDIKQLISETVETMQSAANLKGITINTDIKVDIPDLVIDSERIIQVFVNLINNAIKFSPNDSIINIKAIKNLALFYKLFAGHNTSVHP